MLDEEEFLSLSGIRSLSKWHKDHPYVFKVHGEEYRVEYLPAESNSGMFGGNSNWRGPVWFPMNVLIIRALLQFYLYYGDNLKVECPSDFDCSAEQRAAPEMAQEPVIDYLAKDYASFRRLMLDRLEGAVGGGAGVREAGAEMPSSRSARTP